MNTTSPWSFRPAVSSSPGPSKGVLSTLFLLAFFCSTLFSVAAPVDADQALQAARGWLKLSPKHMGAPFGATQPGAKGYADSKGQRLFYVVELASGGFVVVSPDDELEPVVAFSSSSRFVADPANALFHMLNQDMPKRLGKTKAAAPKAAPGAAPSPQKGKWDRLLAAGSGQATASPFGGTLSLNDVRVAPLVQSQWDQGTVNTSSGAVAVYNYYTPPGEAGDPANYICGCVATAWSQILRYHRWPQAGVGASQFQITVDNVNKMRALRGGDGAGGPYDWDNMVLVPGPSITLAQRQAIGALTHDAGVANHMEYSADWSGAWVDSVSIKSVFHYASAVHATNEVDFPGAIQASLDAGLPVHLAIYDAYGWNGHAVVCDGYGYEGATLYNHINLGWGGDSDAWYNLPHIDDPWMAFEILSDVIYNIDPTAQGEIISGRLTRADGSPIVGTSVTAESGSLTLNSTTSASGIYFFKGVPSNSSWHIVPHFSGTLTPAYQDVTTGHSSDLTSQGNCPGIDFQEPQGPGWIQVTLEPQDAVDAGATWRVDGAGPWMTSGTSVFVSSGVHFISFSDVAGWYTPAPKRVTVSKDKTTATSVIYTAPWKLAMLSSPPEGGRTGAFPLPNNSGFYSGGAVVYANCVANPGYGFVSWTENGAVVSKDKKWTFVGYTDRTLTANFVPLEITAQDDQAYVAGKWNRVTLDVVKNDTITNNYYPLYVSSVTSGTTGSVSILPDGKIRYTSNGSFKGSDTFTYTVVDGFGEMGMATVTILDGLSGCAGSYAGLVSGAKNGDSGYINVSLSVGGKATVKVSVGGEVYNVSGPFSGDLSFQGTIKRSGRPNLFVKFQYDPVAKHIDGSVSSTDGAFSSSFSADRVAFNAVNNPSPLAGTFTALLPPNPALTGTAGPQGYGYLNLTLSRTGVVTAKGKLGDGTAISASGFLETGNVFPFYAGVYGKTEPYRGSIFGNIAFHGNGSAGDYCDGALSWFKPPQLKDLFYRRGFSTTTNLVGSRYIPVKSGTQAVNLATGEADLKGGNLGASITRGITLSPKNVLAVSAPLGDTLKLTLKVTPTTGAFTGSFLDPVTKKKRTLGGVLLQNQGIGAGCFLGNDQSGSVELK